MTRAISTDTDTGENSGAIKGPIYAAARIADIERGTKSRAVRRRMAELAIGPLGNYTPEAKAVWVEYLATF
jgi:hypothetical protein